MICEFNTSKYFLGDIMHVIMTTSEENHNAVVTEGGKQAASCPHFICAFSLAPTRKDGQKESGLFVLSSQEHWGMA